MVSARLVRGKTGSGFESAFGLAFSLSRVPVGKSVNGEAALKKEQRWSQTVS